MSALLLGYLFDQFRALHTLLAGDCKAPQNTRDSSSFCSLSLHFHLSSFLSVFRSCFFCIFFFCLSFLFLFLIISKRLLSQPLFPPDIRTSSFSLLSLFSYRKDLESIKDGSSLRVLELSSHTGFKIDYEVLALRFPNLHTLSMHRYEVPPPSHSLLLLLTVSVCNPKKQPSVTSKRPECPRKSKRSASPCFRQH